MKNIPRISSSKLRAKGASMIETIIVFPILMFVGFGIVHLGLVYQAKSNLELTALMAAKVISARGIANTADVDEVLAEIRYRMAATDKLGTINANDTAGLAASARELSAVGQPRATFTILRPNKAIFDAWGQGACGDPPGDCVIPNDNLLFRDPTDVRNVALSTGNPPVPINIQDANILTLEVSYLLDTGVPFMSLLTIGASSSSTPQSRELPAHESNPFGNKFRGSPGILIKARANILMQTGASANPTSCRFISGYTC